MLIARLVGHVFGDGYIHIRKYYFVYVNSERSLLENVRNIITTLFGEVSLNIGTFIGGIPRYQFSSIVGRTLNEYGAPAGSKIKSPTPIPSWIMYGSEEIIKAFLSAIIDDEASIRKYDITVKAEKIIAMKEYLEKYLSSLKILFNTLGIKASKPHKDQIKTKKNGEKVISMRIWITGRENLKKIKQLNIIHPIKRKIINNYY